MVDIGLANGVKQVLSNGNFWVLAGWFFFQSAAFFSFAGLWGGPYLKHVYNLDRAGAGQILSMLAVGVQCRRGSQIKYAKDVSRS